MSRIRSTCRRYPGNSPISGLILTGGVVKVSIGSRIDLVNEVGQVVFHGGFVFRKKSNWRFIVLSWARISSIILYRFSFIQLSSVYRAIFTGFSFIGLYLGHRVVLSLGVANDLEVYCTDKEPCQGEFPCYRFIVAARTFHLDPGFAVE